MFGNTCMATISINKELCISDSDIQLSAIRAQGAGGQNVNKVSSAIHLRFDIANSSLPDTIKQKLLNSNDSRVTQDGVFIIKSQSHRTQEKNKDNAIQRRIDWIKENTLVQKERKTTKPSNCLLYTSPSPRDS